MHKAAIIINPNLPLGILANAIACITSGLFLNGKDYVGPEIKGKNITYIPITKIPILILKPGNTPLHELLVKIQTVGLEYMAFTKEAQTTTDYHSYIQRVEGKPLSSVSLVGIGVVGKIKEINSLTGNLPMLR